MTEQNTRELWLAERRQGIGGSDLAAILGISKWKTPYDVWLDKTGRHVEPENDNMIRGRLMEPVIRGLYEAKHGVTLTDTGHLIATDPLIMGTPDAMDGETVIEFKSTRWFAFKAWRGEIPIDYWAQMQHYMYLTGARDAVLVVLVDGADMHEFPVTYDSEWTRNAIKQSVEWWQTYVSTDTPPPMPEPKPEPVDGAVMVADEELKSMINELRDIRSLEDDIKARREQIEDIIKETIGTHEAVTIDGKQAVTWKSVTSSRLDTKALRNDLPDIAAKYSVQMITRTFKLTR